MRRFFPVVAVSLTVVLWSPVFGQQATPTEKKAIDRSAEAMADPDAHDWPMYNRDVIGTRHNPAESTLNKENVGGLIEKWRFPAKNSGKKIGVIHATPAVVGGYVYFGTATDAAFYKLSPGGELVWTYRNLAHAAQTPTSRKGENAITDKLRFQSQTGGILGSALVTSDLVYFGDLGGWFVALDRETGKERWKVNTRAAEFPDAHSGNVLIASPILADDRIVVAGGTLEQLFAGSAFYRGSTGRGFVMALNPKSGQLLWKHDVGPKPQRLTPPITITDDWGKHTWNFGPATSSVWSTPSFDAETGTIFFGTDVNTAPRRPTKDDPRIATKDSCAVVAIDVRNGKKKWSTQINPGDMWTNSMRAYDPKTGRYKDQSIGDTPKVYNIDIDGKSTKVVGVGCKNGGFYVLNADDGRIVHHTPIYTGPPTYPLSPEPDRRMLALPSPIGGLQSGCATNGQRVFTNGIDAVRLWTQQKPSTIHPPTGGRVVAVSTDMKTEHWRHERPKIESIGGPKPIPVYENVGDPIASGLAVAHGVVYCTTASSGKLLALDAETGALLKEVALGPTWCGPSVSRGRVYVGTGNTVFTPYPHESFFPKKYTGELISFGLPGEDDVDRLAN